MAQPITEIKKPLLSEEEEKQQKIRRFNFSAGR